MVIIRLLLILSVLISFAVSVDNPPSACGHPYNPVIVINNLHIFPDFLANLRINMYLCPKNY